MPELNADDFTRLMTLFVPEVVSALALSPDGRYLAVAAGDKIHIHRFPADKMVAGGGAPVLRNEDFPRLTTLYMPEKISAMLFSPDGKLLTAAAADKIHILHVPIPAS